MIMNFPNLITTQAEAQRLAADVFPGERLALARLAPGTAHPRYQMTMATAAVLRDVFEWLHQQRPRIHKRARWPLFYDLAQRITDQLDSNAQAKVMDLYAQDNETKWRMSRATQTMNGDGEGI
jgi:hypothetical protein